MSLNKRQAGFSLVEALTATAVFGFTISSSIIAVNLSIQYLDKAFQKIDAQLKAQNSIELISSQSDKEALFDEIIVKKDVSDSVSDDSERNRMVDKIRHNFIDTGKQDVKEISIQHRAKNEQMTTPGILGFDTSIKLGNGEVKTYTRYFYE